MWHIFLERGSIYDSKYLVPSDFMGKIELGNILVPSQFMVGSFVDRIYTRVSTGVPFPNTT